ncbi:multiple sugar transport system permease protein [Pararhizobium capsulatum DSM 1112]|uniref:Multiple sugar transport system permease protein n=1 Tax=Pararhizobium capsulatum DSM 1112 TaxID=1121113 RepID=A0ABU0BYE5_9HYPH|nr:sugar ABC transporter permease [Pararhizobium capsulatum]MDQ0323279.1 multiple sugar transport system permease protein [Pararhizobium capsulatum DSM 1112]
MTTIPVQGTALPPATKTSDNRRERRATLFLLGPALTFLAVLSVWPFVYLIYASFTSYQLAIPIPIEWVGVDNFTRMMTNPRFWSSLGITGIFALVAVPLQIVAGLSMALLLNGVTRGREFYASLFLIPMMVAPIVVGFSWNLFLNPIYGPLNNLLKAIGFDPPAWAQSPDWALPTLVVVDTWQWTPFVMIVLLAGLNSIPQRVYEAARVDGSNRWQTFVHIVLPMLFPYMMVAFVLRFIDSFRVFDIIYILTRGGPGTATQNLAYYTYDMGFGRFEFSIAGALSIIQLVLLTGGTMAILSFAKSREKGPVSDSPLPPTVFNASAHTFQGENP